MLKRLYWFFFGKREKEEEKEIPRYWRARFILPTGPFSFMYTARDCCDCIERTGSILQKALNRIFFNGDDGMIYIYVNASRIEDAKKIAAELVMKSKDRISNYISNQQARVGQTSNGEAMTIPTASSGSAIPISTLASATSITRVGYGGSQITHSPRAIGDLMLVEGEGLFISPNGSTWQRISSAEESTLQAVAPTPSNNDSGHVHRIQLVGYEDSPIPKEKKPSKPRKKKAKVEPKETRGLVIYKNGA